MNLIKGFSYNILVYLAWNQDVSAYIDNARYTKLHSRIRPMNFEVFGR